MKIHIIGCSGSGKTYLANALSKKYHIPHFDLDNIQWDNNAKEYDNKVIWLSSNKDVEEIIKAAGSWSLKGKGYENRIGNLRM